MAEKTAIFAGGCFCCMVEPFETLPGIIKVRSGYTGGFKDNPTYEEVKAHKTGHTEAVKVWFDDSVVDYKDLVDLYWQTADPTDAMGQFQDRGDNYRPVIFVASDGQLAIAEASKQQLVASGIFGDDPIVTKIEKAVTFWDAEEEHQQFYRKHADIYADEKQDRDAYKKKYWDKTNK
jgi:peptide-methionine (S)-S-oxide reductase